MARTKVRACTRQTGPFSPRTTTTTQQLPRAFQPTTEPSTRVDEAQVRNEEESENDVTIVDHDVLDCSICYQPLRPPLFQCNSGHVACPTCFEKLSNKCHICSNPIGDSRMIALEKILEASKISCPNKPRGCPARIPYYQKSEHNNSCPYRPCFCPYDFCNFADSPSLLLQHAKTHHELFIHEFQYGVAFYVFISDSSRFKVLTDGEDRMFLLSLSHISQGKRALSMVCVCGPGSHAPELSYKLTLEIASEGSSSSNNNNNNNRKRCRGVKFSGPVMCSTLEEGIGDNGAFLLVSDNEGSNEFLVCVRINASRSSVVKEEVIYL